MTTDDLLELLEKLTPEQKAIIIEEIKKMLRRGS